MSVSYSTNWMGPVTISWYKDRGLTHKVSEVLQEDRKFFPKGLGPGDVWEYDEITTHYCAGRIDIRDSTKYGYDGWDEYAVAPMHAEDWYHFGEWLDTFETVDVWKYEHLLEMFEKYYGKKIRWWSEEDES